MGAAQSPTGKPSSPWLTFLGNGLGAVVLLLICDWALGRPLTIVLGFLGAPILLAGGLGVRGSATYLAVLLTGGVLLSLLIGTGIFYSLPFHAGLWHGTDDLSGVYYSHRERMAEGLLESGRLEGMTVEEVVDLLGTTPEIVHRESQEPVRQIAYTIGWTWIDPILLYIWFDEDGVFHSAEIMQGS